MNTREVLEAAKRLIDSPHKWRRGFGDPRRVCAGIALDQAAGTENPSRNSARVALARAMGYEGADARAWSYVVDANDRSTHAEVMAAFDRAIKAAA